VGEIVGRGRKRGEEKKKKKEKEVGISKVKCAAFRWNTGMMG
jgi:hypothetical protein